MAPPIHTLLGYPLAFMSWSELVLILLALFVFGLPVLLRLLRAPGRAPRSGSRSGPSSGSPSGPKRAKVVDVEGGPK